MEDDRVFNLIGQYLTEHKYPGSLAALEKESGRKYIAGNSDNPGELQAILDEHRARERQKREAAVCVGLLFSQGEGEYANKLWHSFDDLSGGLNILVVKLIENGVVAFGAPKSTLGTMELSVPLDADGPTVTPIPTLFTLSASSNPKGAILALDFHPQKRNLLICGSMDRQSHLIDVDQGDQGALQSFEHHTKYVVRALWSPSGKYFVTGSYDHTVCVYRQKVDSEEYELAQRLELSGAVEAVTFAKDDDVFVVGVRNDYRLHCYDLSSGNAVKAREINMNSFGDDFVSFVAMHVSFSPDGKYLLVSTDRDRLIIYSWDSGKQITNFYGATNDEYSQPRHCWDPSGRYIYGTSQDKSIIVWEIKSQNIVARLTGHTGTVRDVQYCTELGVLVSCGFDGTIKMWKNCTRAEN